MYRPSVALSISPQACFWASRCARYSAETCSQKGSEGLGGTDDEGESLLIIGEHLVAAAFCFPDSIPENHTATN